jgi:hypothetical protein
MTTLLYGRGYENSWKVLKISGLLQKQMMAHKPLT